MCCVAKDKCYLEFQGKEYLVVYPSLGDVLNDELFQQQFDVPS